MQNLICSPCPEFNCGIQPMEDCVITFHHKVFDLAQNLTVEFNRGWVRDNFSPQDQQFNKLFIY